MASVEEQDPDNNKFGLIMAGSGDYLDEVNSGHGLFVFRIWSRDHFSVFNLVAVFRTLLSITNVPQFTEDLRTCQTEGNGNLLFCRLYFAGGTVMSSCFLCLRSEQPGDLGVGRESAE